MGRIDRVPKANKRAGIKPRPSTARAVKKHWHINGRGMSLRAFAREHCGEDGEDWLFNKRQNFSKSPLGIGRTRGRAVKGKGGRGGKS